MNKAIHKWHIWDSLKKNLPLCWDGQVLVFDTKESAIDFLHSAIAYQEDLDQAYAFYCSRYENISYEEFMQLGFFETKKVQTVVNKTVFTPSKLANKIGITCEETVDKKTGEVKSQIKLEPSAQLFIIENLEEIVSST